MSLNHPLLFVGQAPPRVVAAVPFGRTRLYRWFETVGVSQEELLAGSETTALVSYFPGKASSGGDKPPSAREIAAERERLNELIRRLAPRAIIPVGTLSIRELMGDPEARLEQVIGNRYSVQCLPDRPPFLIIPLPHPSGASPWVHIGDNAQLLERAVIVIRGELRRA